MASRANAGDPLGIGLLFRVGAAGALSDGQLLERFVDRPGEAAGEAAFEALATRHGPMVLAACRAVLRDEHTAEDAFQATFLVLARRARSVREADLLGPWLHRVARRIALRAQAESARRRARETGSVDPVGLASPSDDAPDRGEIRALVHEEVGRLPERYRVPVVLCHLEGLSYEEAARRLRCPVGTVRSRLARAREQLRSRLTRRGLAPAVGLSLTIAAPGAVSASLVASTVRASSAFVMGPSASGGVPATAASLAEGVLKTMSWARTFRNTALILLLGAVTAGVVMAALQEPGRRKGDSARKGATAKAADDNSLLTNGGVEDGRNNAPAAWSSGARIDGVQYLWDKKVAHSGKASLCLKKTAPRYFPIAQWFQEVRLSDAPARVKVGAWVKANRATKATLDVQFLDDAGEMLDHKWVAYIGAKEANDPPATHDWKWYEDTVDVPAGTKRLLIAPQIYGPGTVWFDDLTASAAGGAAKAPPAAKGEEEPREDGDIADVPSVEHTVGGDAKKRYFLIGPAGKAEAPAEGYRLLVILPGGDGSAEFNPFLRRIARNALPPGYLVAQPVAFEWQPGQAKSIVWPVAANKLPGQKFSTEEFVEGVIADVRRAHKIDPRYVFLLGWSSGGPPTYATSLRPASGVTGSFVAMSIFPKPRLPELGRARGRAYYLLHSPQDFIPIRTAESARDTLRQSGAQVELKTYEGGHGWHGDVFGNIRAGIQWLEANHSPATGG